MAWQIPRLVSPVTRHFGQLPLMSLRTERHSLMKVNTVLLRRGFHTTPKRDVHPLILLIFKPVGKLTAMITGR